MKFKAKMQILGVNPYVLVSAVQAEQIMPDWRKPMPVKLRVNGQPDEQWHINMMPVGNGEYYLYLHGEVRKAAGTKVGDVVSIELEFDYAYKGGPSALPEWFAKALTSHKTALSNWKKLPPSRQKEVVRYFANLKSPEARSRNLDRAIRVLSGEEGQFMGRLWRGGS